jgi:hypothetical protein
MAVRPYRIRFSGGTVATATIAFATLFSTVGSPRAEAARRQWSDEPIGSVLVQSSPSYREENVVVEPGHEPMFGDGETVVGDGAYADFGAAGGGCCPSCTGVGCDECCPSALFDSGCHEKNACWIGRVDALILWRNAPPDRPLVNNGLVAGTLLNANGMESTAAAGPRFSVFRVNNCTGHAIEATYLRAANFRSVRPLSLVSEPYELAAPGIYGNTGLTFDSGNANLGSRLQSFEFNRHHCHGKFIRFLAGFRWI